MFNGAGAEINVVPVRSERAQSPFVAEFPVRNYSYISGGPAAATSCAALRAPTLRHSENAGISCLCHKEQLLRILPPLDSCD